MVPVSSALTHRQSLLIHKTWPCQWSLWSPSVLQPDLIIRPWSWSVFQTASQPAVPHITTFFASGHSRRFVWEFPSAVCWPVDSRETRFCLISSSASHRLYTSRSICRSGGALLCMWRKMKDNASFGRADWDNLTTSVWTEDYMFEIQYKSEAEWWERSEISRLCNWSSSLQGTSSWRPHDPLWAWHTISPVALWVRRVLWDGSSVSSSLHLAHMGSALTRPFRRTRQVLILFILKGKLMWTTTKFLLNHISSWDVDTKL